MWNEEKDQNRWKMKFILPERSTKATSSEEAKNRAANIKPRTD
ncbi:hypothetical protein [Bacillus safensis]